MMKPMDWNRKRVAAGWRAMAVVLVAAAGLVACQENGPVPPSLIGVIEPKPTASPEPPDNGGGPAPDATAYYTGPAELSKYVAKFISDGRLQGVDVTGEMSNPKLTIRVASLDSYGASVIGLCETSANTRRVTFDPDFWNSVSEAQRELLAHHELGHCVLYRAHRTGVLSSGIYASLMYPTIMKSSTYTTNYDYYQNELFQYSALEVPLNDDPNRITTHVCDQKELAGISEGGEE